MTEPCIQERAIGALETDMKRAIQHCIDGEAKDGPRDKLTKLEVAMASMKWYMFGCGVIGGLIGAGCPEAVRLVVSWIH